VANVPLPARRLDLPARPAHPRRLAALVREHRLAGPAKRLEAALHRVR
jgi:hypothetical protein